MKRVWSKWMVVLAGLVISMTAARPVQAQGSVSLQVFYDELQPHGTWVDHSRYGYVWLPNTGPDFVPYGTNGYWVNTAYGNTWVSDYSWGWAPFHYGRWFYDDFYGWLWVPDTVWGPAWVAWRSGGGYYGWAPLMPGIGISMSVGYYNRIPHHYWNFVPHRYVMYRHVYRHCVPRPRVVNVINNTTVIVNNNYYDNGRSAGQGRPSNGRDRATYFTGPSRSEIEQKNGERVPVYEVHDRQNPGHTEVSRRSVSLYKPAVDNSPAVRSRAMPAQFTRDDASGRQALTETRTRQVPVDNNVRQPVRRNDGTVPANRIPERSTGDVGALRRNDETQRIQRQGVVERTQRDADFNRMENNREAERMQLEQRDVQRRGQLNRSSEPARQQQPAQQRELQMERSQPRQSMPQMAPRQSAPSREQGQVQQRSAPVQRREVAPSQRQQPVRPQLNRSQSPRTNPQLQRSAPQRSTGTPQRTRTQNRN